ncbi:Ligand-binding SRPBCC domain-containing protein [Granulicella rosea]|uniref:Ligand-binding SRPBCC domain-containing protein n=1 Tax=Granulicella rosea TaxID=474952 RepID=A0A239DSC0_9BACT|nr:SRPBCC family protein [Granulicella rosea]SNS34464.1 Ligand-binding SRPBCC domain-containing protein [Granulicella rosea]
MFFVKDHIHIEAPVERCFLLSTSIEAVGKVLGMRAVSGKTSGLVVEGDQLIWRGWKFGLPQMHETLITGYEYPHFFQDTMGRGRFSYFQHDHRFDYVDGHTFLHDTVRFSMPLGPAGRLVGRSLIVPHVRDLLQRRFAMLKELAEGDGWREYLSAAQDVVEAHRISTP